MAEAPIGRTRPLWWHLTASALVFIAWTTLAGGFLVLDQAAIRVSPAAATAWVLGILALFLLRYFRPVATPNSRQAETLPRLAPADVSGGQLALAVLLVLAWVTAAAVVVMRFVPAEDLPAYEVVFDYAARPGGALPVLLFVGALAPVVEETAFRGWIQGPLERRLAPWIGIGIAATVFALAHPQGASIQPLLFGYYLGLGLVLGWSVRLTGSLWMGIAIHAAVNLWMVALAVLDVDVTLLAGTRGGVAGAIGVLGFAIVGLVALGTAVHRRGGRDRDSVEEPWSSSSR